MKGRHPQYLSITIRWSLPKSHQLQLMYSISPLSTCGETSLWSGELQSDCKEHFMKPHLMECQPQNTKTDEMYKNYFTNRNYILTLVQSTKEHINRAMDVPNYSTNWAEFFLLFRDANVSLIRITAPSSQCLYGSLCYASNCGRSCCADLDWMARKMCAIHSGCWQHFT